jgi:hypothetical protein
LLDNFIEDELLQDIPVLGEYTKPLRIIKSIPDRIFLAKVSLVMKSIDKITPEQRLEFLKRHESDLINETVGEALVLILNKMDDMDKPEMLERYSVNLSLEMYHILSFVGFCKAIDISLFLNCKNSQN